MPDDDVGFGHEGVDALEERLAATVVPFGEADDVGAVVPLGANDGGSGLADDRLVVDVAVLEVASVPPVLGGDAVEPFHVEDQDAVADTGRDGGDLRSKAHPSTSHALSNMIVSTR